MESETRTALAKERTKLAYVRTALTSLIAGVTLNKLFVDNFTNAVSYALFIFAIILFGMAVFKTSVRNI
jgi:uncharacterized membrane protein YidH (DUF202 family)